MTNDDDHPSRRNPALSSRGPLTSEHGSLSAEPSGFPRAHPIQPSPGAWDTQVLWIPRASLIFPLIAATLVLSGRS